MNRKEESQGGMSFPTPEYLLWHPRNEELFSEQFVHDPYVLVTTTMCSEEVSDRLTAKISLDGLSWAQPIRTYTNREILRGRLSNGYNPNLPDVIFKKSNYNAHNTDILDQ